MTHKSYAQALVDGLEQALREDEAVSLIGSYVLGLGPQRTLMDGLRKTYGDRIVDPPTAEGGVAGVGAGAAMAGGRPFVDIGTASFIYPAWSQIVNEAANAHYMSGGQLRVPVVYHMLHGLRGGGAAQHSHSPQAMLWNCPGLEIVLPSTPRDVQGLLLSAVRSDNPTILIDHARLLGIEGDVPEGDGAVPLGQAEVKRTGSDVTVVATSLMVHHALQAAEQLAADGISAEVVDPRTLVPLDEETVLASVGKTGRLVVVDECHLRCSVASEIAATVAEEGFDLLRAPIRRVATLQVPVPFSRALEEYIQPDAGKIAATVRAMF